MGKTIKKTQIRVAVSRFYLLKRNFVYALIIEETQNNFAQRGARTHDPEIKSLMLYRLS